MTSIVVDNSVFLVWCLAGEEEPTATGAMRQVAESGGVTPRIWWYELRNALLVNERRGRISSHGSYQKLGTTGFKFVLSPIQ